MTKKHCLIIRVLLALPILLIFSQTGFSQEINNSLEDVKVAKVYGVTVENNGIDVSKRSEMQKKSNPASTSQLDRMNAKAKLKYGVDAAFLNPGVYIFPALSATRQQLTEDLPNKDTGDKFADGLSRYAINFGTASTKALFSSGIYPIIFKQNPRYEPSQKHGFGPRLVYAVSRVFVTRGDNGELQFNSSRMAGGLTASGLANLWERNTPGHERIGTGPTFRRFGKMIALDIVRSVVLKEFGPDLKRLLLRR